VLREQPTDVWNALVRTAAMVRADEFRGEVIPPAPRWRRHLRGITVSAVMTAALAVLAAHLISAPAPASADGGADSTLFSMTNQDRSSNGVGSVVFNGTLSTIGEGGRYNGCGFAVNGRSVDMIQRNYFAHPIAGCGKLVFSIMQAYGVRYQSAGENIGWVSGESNGGQAASYINGQFMNSPDHRSNILNGNYTDLGVGSALSAPGVNWTGAGSPGYQNVWMFSEEFAQLHASAPPPPPPPPNNNPPRNAPGPAAPGQPPASTAPTPVPTPVPAPTPTPIPSGLLPAIAPPPPPYQYQGLLAGSIESVLEAFLIP
jgi:uncharacterized protein YkwD